MFQSTLVQHSIIFYFCMIDYNPSHFLLHDNIQHHQWHKKQKSWLSTGFTPGFLQIPNSFNCLFDLTCMKYMIAQQPENLQEITSFKFLSPLKAQVKLFYRDPDWMCTPALLFCLIHKSTQCCSLWRQLLILQVSKTSWANSRTEI